MGASLILAFAISLALAPICRKIAPRFGLVARTDDPGRGGIAAVGGVAVAASLAVSVLVFGNLDGAGVLAAGAAIALLAGLAADAGAMTHDAIPVSEIGIASLFLLLGHRLQWVHSTTLDWMLTLIWTVGVIRAFRMLDRFDGLCLGVAVIAGAFVAGSAAAAVELSPWNPYLASLLGALSGVFVYNLRAASIGMGESGRLLIGACFAGLALIPGSRSGGSLLSVVAAPVFVLTAPTLTTMWAAVSRICSDREGPSRGPADPPERPHPIILPARYAVRLLSLLAATGGLIGIALEHFEHWWSTIVVALAGIALLAIHRGIEVSGVSDGAARGRAGLASVRLDTGDTNRMTEMLLDAVLVTASYYAAFRLKFDYLDFVGQFAHMERSLPIVLVSQLVAWLALRLYPAGYRDSPAFDGVAAVRGVMIATTASALIVRYLFQLEGFPFKVFVIYGFIVLPAILGSRKALGAIRGGALEMPPKLTRWIVELGAVGLIFSAVSVFSAHLQRMTPPTPESSRGVLFRDGAKYLDMARQFRAGSRVVSAPAPWVYRIATPWLASFASKSQIDAAQAAGAAAAKAGRASEAAAFVSESQIRAALPFYVINIAAAFVAAALLLVWLSRFVQSSGMRVLLVTMFLVTWVGPARFVYFQPAYVDPLFLVFLMTGLLLVDASRLRPVWQCALLLSPVVFVGTLSRESMGIVALAFLGCRNPFAAMRIGRWRDAAWTTMPLLAALLAFAFVHRVTIPTGPETARSLPLNLIGHKWLLTWILTWFFTFGPAVVAIVVADGGRPIEFLRQEPHLMLYLLGCGALSYLGGVDDERITLWAAPVVYVLAARAITRHRAALRSIPLLVTLTAAQIVSTRLLWPVPTQGPSVAPISSARSIGEWTFDSVNRLVVIDTYYQNLWSFSGSRRWHLALLAYDIGFVALIVAWIRSSEHSDSLIAPPASPECDSNAPPARPDSPGCARAENRRQTAAPLASHASTADSPPIPVEDSAR
jgi:UDP-N-acetylmuramyl pentapeptide phosphotransferase/UDP-N-acetylglucosamine-1-phosphate transferase